MILLSYILSLKPDSNLKNLNDFYNKHIKNDTELITINKVTHYKNYKNFINKKNM